MSCSHGNNISSSGWELSVTAKKKKTVATVALEAGTWTEEFGFRLVFVLIFLVRGTNTHSDVWFAANGGEKTS